MPFANLGMPSLALTQLAWIIKTRFSGSIEINTAYLHLDFARYFSNISYYTHVSDDNGFMTGIGDWFFRQSAFPDEPDNSKEYFDRFYFQDDARTRELRQEYGNKRAGLNDFLDGLIEKYDIASSDIVGFTALFSQTVASLAMARRLKLRNPAIITCMGGAACEGIMGVEFARNTDSMDYIFSGPALISFPELIQNIQKKDVNACESIDGVFTRSNTKEEPSVLLGDNLEINTNVQLDYTPFLDAFEETFPGREINSVLLFETSRGCYWGEKFVCTFCGLNGLQRCYRQMTPEKALAQIQSLERWAPRCSSFIAVDTAMPREYIKEVFPFFENRSHLKIMYEVRTDLKREDLDIMSQAGIAALQPGIEALSTDTLKLMRKGSTAFRNIIFLKACSYHTISLDWNLLTFSPGEDEGTLEKYLHDIPLLMHLAPPRGVFPIMYVRHSMYFEDPDAYGLDLHPQDFYKLTYPFDESIIKRIANYFVDHNANTGRMDAWMGKLNGAIAHWRKRWLGSDGKPEARLCFYDEKAASLVYDSRAGQETRYLITPSAKRVIEALEKPLSIADIERVFNGDMPREEVQKALEFLTERGLLFEEKGRYLSLIAV